MSASSGGAMLAERVAEPVSGPDPQPPIPPGSPAPVPVAAPPNPLQLLAAYIPSESIAAYIGILAFIALTPLPVIANWIAVIFCLALNVFATNASFQKVVSVLPIVTPKPGGLTALHFIYNSSFLLYVFALPESPLEDAFPELDTAWIGLAAILATFSYPSLAKRFGLRLEQA